MKISSKKWQRLSKIHFIFWLAYLWGGAYVSHILTGTWAKTPFLITWIIMLVLQGMFVCIAVYESDQERKKEEKENDSKGTGY